MERNNWLKHFESSEFHHYDELLDKLAEAAHRTVSEGKKVQLCAFILKDGKLIQQLVPVASDKEPVKYDDIETATAKAIKNVAEAHHADAYIFGSEVSVDNEDGLKEKMVVVCLQTKEYQVARIFVNEEGNWHHLQSTAPNEIPDSRVNPEFELEGQLTNLL